MLPDSSESTERPTKVIISECMLRLAMPSSMIPRFLTEADATGAVNAAAHFFHRNQRTDILVEDDVLFFGITALHRAVTDGHIPTGTHHPGRKSGNPAGG